MHLILVQLHSVIVFCHQVQVEKTIFSKIVLLAVGVQLFISVIIQNIRTVL